MEKEVKMKHKPYADQMSMFPSEEIPQKVEDDSDPGSLESTDLQSKLPITKHGDLWHIGRHRLLCGDSANPTDIERLLDGNKVQLVHTDPPYNVCVQPQSKDKDTAKARKLEGDFISKQEFTSLLYMWFTHISRALEPGEPFYIWGGYSNIANYLPIIKSTGLFFAQTIIWVKSMSVYTRKDFMGKHEWCFYGWKEGAPHKWTGPNNITDVWEIPNVPRKQMVHLTEKPVEIPFRAITYSSSPGDSVLDIFGGSGSTLIAADQLDRVCYLMEIDPAYCDVIVKRCKGLHVPIKRYQQND